MNEQLKTRIPDLDLKFDIDKIIDPTAKIHPTAIIADSVHIGVNVKIGPGTIIGSDVFIGDNTVIHSHVVLKGSTYIGKNNEIYQFSSIGEDCQDKKYKGERTFLYVGDNNVIREYCTIHRGTIQDRGITYIGNDNLLMSYTHIAHDCVLLNNIVMSNSSGLAGHVFIGNNVILGGFTGVHQFCQISDYSMSGGHSGIFKDVPAFMMVSGNPAKVYGMNYEGMKRLNFSSSLINTLKNCYKVIYRENLRMDSVIAELESMPYCEEVQLIINSLKSSTRGIVR